MYYHIDMALEIYSKKLQFVIHSGRITLRLIRKQDKTTEVFYFALHLLLYLNQTVFDSAFITHQTATYCFYLQCSPFIFNGSCDR